MSRKKISPNNQNNQSKNKRHSRRQKGASLSFGYRLLMFGCAACLLVGFFFAARQHFSSIDFSIKNSRLRKMSEELESDKRRLLLSKEIALSPTEIKKAAQKIGFKVMNAGSNAVSSLTAEKQESRRSEKTSAPKPKPKAANKTAETAAEKKIKEEKPASEPKVKKEPAPTAK